jgi:hypothetical protein
MSYNYFQQTLVPSTTAWSIGTINNPFKDIWLSFGSLNLSNKTTGVTGIAIDNRNGFLTLGAGSAGLQLQDQFFNTNFQITSAAQFTMYTPTALSGQYGAFNIVGSANRAIQPITSNGVMMHITGNDGLNNRVVFDSYGTATFPQLIGRSARGSALTPTYTLSGDTLFRITANGYNALSGFILPNGSVFSPTTIEAVATESFSGSSVGTEWRVYNATKGDTTDTKRLDAVFNNTGITVPVSGAGITFGDGTFQNTAFTQAIATSIFAASGTWTPVLSCATGNTSSLGYQYRYGNYTKAGQNVYATFSILLSTLDGAAGNVVMSNLPFAPVNGNGVWGDLRVASFSGMSDSKLATLNGFNENSSSVFELYYTDNNGGGTTNHLTVAQLGATTMIRGGMNYIAY